jgi:hypothetical protein
LVCLPSNRPVTSGFYSSLKEKPLVAQCIFKCQFYWRLTIENEAFGGVEATGTRNLEYSANLAVVDVLQTKVVAFFVMASCT